MSKPFRGDKIELNMEKVVTRFAPSPTGALHIGHLRTCAYSYALARRKNGKFILRVEDTDRNRYKAEAVEEIKNMMAKYGMKWDEYYVQSERAKEGIYIKTAEKLVSDGHAYFCQCKPRNAKEMGYSKILRDPCRDKNLTSGAIKLKILENEKIGYFDFVIGKEINWNTSDVFEATILKSPQQGRLPTYHLAVVVDDHDMGVSHVLRGYDWLPSTPVHLLLYKYLGFQTPQIGHLSDIQSGKGGKLSKRKGSTSLTQLESMGYLPEAIFNFTILLGWAPKDNQELFDLNHFIKAFDINGFQKSNPLFNQVKLDWFNKEYIRKSDTPRLALLVYNLFEGKYPKDKIGKILPLIKERIKTLCEFDDIAGFFFAKPKIVANLLGKNAKVHLNSALKILNKKGDLKLSQLNKEFQEVIEKEGYKTGDFFMDLRVALTGSKFTPPVNESIIILGKDDTIERIKNSLKYL